MKKLNINIFVSLTFFLNMASCAGKIVHLEKNNYELSKNASLYVISLKQTEDKIEFHLLGISREKDEVGIKKDEIQCGAGNELFGAIKIEGVTEDFIILPKTTFKEFQVICTQANSLKNKGKPFLIFRKIYNLKNKSLDQVIGSDLKIEFK